jgi:hemolysin D
MPLPEPTAPAPETPGGSPQRDAPKLTLVKPVGRSRELTAMEREFLPPLLEIQESPPSPLKRLVLLTIVALVIALIVWASVGKMSIVATAPGKFVPEGRVKTLQPLEASIVKSIHVREGQHVNVGDLLLELDPTLSAADMNASADRLGFNQLEQARLVAELTHKAPLYAPTGQPPGRLALEERIRQAREQAHTTKLAGAQAAAEEKAAALAAAEATLQKYQEVTGIAEEREAGARPLVETGAIARVDYLQLKEDLAKNRNDFASQQKTVQQARAAVVEADRAFEQVRRDRVAEIYKDLDDRVTSEPELNGGAQKSRELYALKWLRAPVSGYVQRVDVATIGQVVTAAQSLVTIVPDGTPLIVEATATNQDIGYLIVGQPVEIKVDTFPFQKYGTLKGTLEWISPDAEDRDGASTDSDTRSGTADSKSNKNKDDAATANNAGYVYKIRVRTEQSQFRVNGETRPLQAGMTVQADITTDKRRVIDFFLSPVVKYLDEGLKVR